MSKLQEAHKVQVGHPVPNFEGTDSHGKSISSKSLLGQKYVLYFYAKDDTSLCTQQACGIRDSKEKFSKLGIQVFGVSPDDAASHAQFESKYKLNFSLLSDPHHKISEAFGAWEDKGHGSSPAANSIRATFIIDEKGIVRWAELPSEPNGHQERILKALQSLNYF